MMTLPSSRHVACLLVSAFFALVTSVGMSATSVAAPKILKAYVSGTNLIVTASVPRGWQSVTLESRASPGQGAWVPRAVVRSKVLAPLVAFRVSATLKGQSLRVSGEPRTSAPLTFFNGKRAFSSQRSSFWHSDLGAGSAYQLAADGNPQVGAQLPDMQTTATRSVEESDIWKISGDTLYFFNQYRGLQVISISDPDAPVIRGTLNLPAVGEQMYVLDSRHVALLARSGSSYDQSQVTVVDVSEDEPRLLVTLPMEGSVLESRLVGTALYVAVQSYSEVAVGDSSEWQWGTSIRSFDLADPSAPVTRSSLWFPGQGNAVTATDRFLFVATQDYNMAQNVTVVQVIDISAADGTMREMAGIATAGWVTDKFRMNVEGDVFAVISEMYDTSVTNSANPSGAWLTELETFSLADAANPAPLGHLDLAPGERLFATRFDGNRAYAVTYQVVDPLWIIDLSDPSQPRVAGQVEVPGWTSYIHPMGGRLVSIGEDAGHVAVSLFDVSDPAHSSLLARVPLGDGYSWSEACWNEKALSVFADDGLILVPYEGFDSDGYASRVQLIDLTDTSLTARGVFEHRCQPRRTALHRGRVLSISGKELLSVNVSDRDHPQIKATTELSWAVNHVFAQGDYLLQLETPSVWSAGEHAVVRIAAKAQPDNIVNRIDLGTMPVVGNCVRDGRLYVLQSPGSGDGGGVVVMADGMSQSDVTTNLLLTVLDLSALPDIHVMGQTEAAADEGVTGQFEAVWPKAGLLVWVSSTSSYWMNPLLADGLSSTVGANPATAPASGGTTASGGGSTAGETAGGASGETSGGTSRPPRPATASASAKGVSCVAFWPWWNVGGVRLLAFKTDDPTAPAFVSQYRFNRSMGWGFSTPFVAQGKIYFSYEQSENAKAYGPLGGPVYDWRMQSFLDVVDYSDPAVPTERPAVCIPGQLAGVSPDGAMLYLQGSAMSRSGVPVESVESLYACAYDGVSAYLVSSLALPAAWPHPVRVDSIGRIFLGRASADELTAPRLEAWSLSASGVFVQKASATLERPASAIACFDDLLAVQDTNGGLALFDAEDPAILRPCGTSDPAAGVWFDLTRASGSLEGGVWIPLDDFWLAGVPVD